MIRRVTVYETRGKQFKTADEALAHRFDLIGEFFDKTPGFWQLPLKEHIAFVQSVVDRRKELAELLDYSPPPEDD